VLKSPANPTRTLVSKVADVLRCFEGGRSYTLTEVARVSSLPLSTAYRIVNDLVCSGVLRRTERGHYLLQPWLFGPHGGHGRSFCGAMPVLDDLAAVTQKVVRLTTQRDDQPKYLERVPGRSDAPPLERIDERPLHATATGKVLLAFAPRSVVDGVLAAGLAPLTRRTVTEVADFCAQLARTRRSGMAFDWGEHDESISAIAVPIFGARRHLTAALEVCVGGESELRRTEQAAFMAARTLSRRMAAEQPAAPVPSLG
jgi:IclR family transcriptional regulator, acetate operon repressor